MPSANGANLVHTGRNGGAEVCRIIPKDFGRRLSVLGICESPLIDPINVGNRRPARRWSPATRITARWFGWQSKNCHSPIILRYPALWAACLVHRSERPQTTASPRGRKAALESSSQLGHVAVIPLPFTPNGCVYVSSGAGVAVICLSHPEAGNFPGAYLCNKSMGSLTVE